jgi:hypothetical protein
VIDMIFSDTIFLVDSAVAFFSRIRCYFLRENEPRPILSIVTRLQTGRPQNLRSVSRRKRFLFHYIKNSALPSVAVAEEE